jgi:hypothetical protein
MRPAAALAAAASVALARLTPSPAWAMRASACSDALSKLCTVAAAARPAASPIAVARARGRAPR